ncbi:long-chain acyl-CoA synthetase [Thalassotalea insulae]|uniref:Long-chain acyl-CoA synthetase n=1 Tax=Thalassotalea insulae TaxID=2056778 RepID=A0ABQ6GQZ9_9GAMM|nr:AMP-binding protein [Thalassotalea insulae]GLX77101.1 long-chain acyl-CoA synthetase [Thalassotalea insulae]
MSLIDSIKQHQQKSVALSEESRALNYQQLISAVNELSAWLVAQKVTNVVLIADNSIDWVLVDLACQESAVCLTPIPTFFSGQQQQHVLSSVKPELVISAQGDGLNQVIDFPLCELNAFRVKQVETPLLPKGTTKVTFTSGSTGQPKGVCLDYQQQLNVANALRKTIDIEQPCHLSLLPFSLLLENIAGIYAPLLAGGIVKIANEHQRGFNGCQLQSVERLLALISQSNPNSFILVPELLLVLIGASKQGWQAPQNLSFIAVGGSKTSASVLAQARELGLPVYQGYGLSEVSSVVSLQSPKQMLDNASVGQLLPHINAEIRNDELVVTGNCFLGYLGQPESWCPQEVATGDLMSMKGKQLFYQGRKKNLLVNSYGRNISPEWLESELLASGLFSQVLVLGDNQPYCVALLVPVNSAVSTNSVAQFIMQVNQGLPQYAKIENYLCLTQAFSPLDNLLTTTGKLKRANIARFYQNEIYQLYQQPTLSEQTAA